jgi:hypothetical protein
VWQTRSVDAQQWVTAGIAAMSIVVSAVIARFTIARQAESHREQLTAREREAQFAAEREHFSRLWEMRQEGYLQLARWAISLRHNIRTARDHGNWTAVESVPLETLAQIFVYADFDVYRQGEFLRGQYEQTMENLEEFRDALTTDSRVKLLESIDDGAWKLIHAVRENALRPPDWREPIPLRPEPSRGG